MAPLTRTESQDVLDKLAQRDSELRKEDEGLSAYVQGAKVLAKYTWLLGSAIVAVTLWTGKMQWDQTKQGDDIKKLNAFRDAAKDIQMTNQMFDQAISNTVGANRMERMNAIENLNENVNRQQKLWDEWTIRFSEMWFGGKNGTPRKETHLRESSILPE